MIELPRELAAHVARSLESADGRRVAAAALEVSQRYRTLAPPTLHSRELALAYAAWLLPATHAQALGSFRSVPLRAGSWTPRSLLDLGGGPGTASWAALDVWPGIETVTIVDREPALLSFGREAAAGAPWPALRDAKWIEGSLPGAMPEVAHDLVVLALVVGESPEERASLILRRAWEACSGVLVVVEPGTPSGFRVVEAARRELVSLGARILAPCPHERACPLAGAPLVGEKRSGAQEGETRRGGSPDEGAGSPMSSDDGASWCHFSERHGRPSFQRRVKEASLSWEDAKHSFVAVARFPGASPPWARVLRHPWHGKGHVVLELCGPEGAVSRTVTKSAGRGWKLARKLEWGSAVESEGDLRG